MNIVVDLANMDLFRGLRRPTPDLIAARLDPFIANTASSLSLSCTYRLRSTCGSDCTMDGSMTMDGQQICII
jgi:hypothetical protein